MTILVGVWATTGADGYWPVWAALGMGAGLAFKALVRRRPCRVPLDGDHG